MSQVPKIWTLILCFEKFSRNWKLKDKKWILYIEKRKIYANIMSQIPKIWTPILHFGAKIKKISSKK